MYYRAYNGIARRDVVDTCYVGTCYVQRVEVCFDGSDVYNVWCLQTTLSLTPLRARRLQRESPDGIFCLFIYLFFYLINATESHNRAITTNRRNKKKKKQGSQKTWRFNLINASLLLLPLPRRRRRSGGKIKLFAIVSCRPVVSTVRRNGRGGACTRG